MTTLKVQYRLIIACVALAIALAGAVWLRPPLKNRVFERYIWHPVPESVADIRLYTRKELGRSTRILRFHISESDIRVVVESRAYRKFDWAKLQSGSLFWGDFGSDYPGDKHVPPENPYSAVNMSQMPVNQNGEELPSWFDLADWPGAKVYVLEDRRQRSTQPDICVLLFNRALNEAYFLRYVGSW